MSLQCRRLRDILELPFNVIVQRIGIIPACLLGGTCKALYLADPQFEHFSDDDNKLSNIFESFAFNRLSHSFTEKDVSRRTSGAMKYQNYPSTDNSSIIGMD